MKTCPQCGRTYPDSEAFCDVDGVGLKSGPVRGTELMEGTVTCPVCGGKSQTGDEVCRFCGAQLASPAAAQPSRPASRKLPSRPLGSSGSFDDEPPQPQAERGGRSFLAGFGYVIAAILALVAGAWFALHVSSKQQQVKVLPPNASPMMSPAAPTTAPFVALARNVQI